VHDPKTLVKTFHLPWPLLDKREVSFRGAKRTVYVPWFMSKRAYYERPLLFAVWHVDPCTDGSDDSCGWQGGKFAARDLRIVERIVKDDLASPLFSSDRVLEEARIANKKYNFLELSPADTISYVSAAWLQIVHIRKHGHRALTNRELTEILDLSTNPVDNLRSVLAGTRDAGQRVRRFVHCVMRAYLRLHRPWYRHPRWHVHHWEIDFGPYDKLRKAMTRCATCGKRLGGHDLPLHAGNWYVRGKQIPKLHHPECYYRSIELTVHVPANTDA
jgi:hypothetical protein